MQTLDKPPSRFRPQYRTLNGEDQRLILAIKYKAAELEDLLQEARPIPTRYSSLALTALEEAVMWAVKEITG